MRVTLSFIAWGDFTVLFVFHVDTVGVPRNLNSELVYTVFVFGGLGEEEVREETISCDRFIALVKIRKYSMRKQLFMMQIAEKIASNSKPVTAMAKEAVNKGLDT